jgi:mannose-6-phosphate isomerase-like protein (cupin superfamily)
MRVYLTLGALVGAVAVVFAQSAPRPKTPRHESAYYSDAQLRDIMQKSPAAFSTRLFQDTTFSTAFIRLAKPDSPHAHGAWSEVFVVKEGSGILETDGTITGVTGHDSATHKDMFTTTEGTKAASQPAPSAESKPPPRNGTPGDLAGTDIEGGHQQQVQAGDVILVPAGVPHRWLKIDQPVVYLDIKFPKAE